MHFACRDCVQSTFTISHSKDIQLIAANEIQTILSVFGEQRCCIATFVPKCEFKPVEPGDLIPQAAFPFAKFVKGKRSVNITFSVKGLNFTSWFVENIRPKCENKGVLRSRTLENSPTRCLWLYSMSEMA
nr:hypothetical transcript [Hymenolepis microstoma]